MGLPQDQYTDLKEQIDESFRWMVEYWVPRARRSRAIYKGNQWLKSSNSDEADETADGLLPIVQNETANNILVKVRALTYQEPAYSVQSKGAPIDPWVRTLIEERLKIDVRATGSWLAIQAALYDKYIYGVGVLMTGLEESDDTDLPYDDEVINGSADGGATLLGPSSVGDSDSGEDEDDEAIGGGGQAPSAPVSDFRPFTTRISPFDFRVPIDTEWWSWQDAPWIAREYVLPVEEARRMPNWKGAEDLGGSQPQATPDKDAQRLDPSDKRDNKMESEQFVVCTEAWYRSLYCPDGFKDDRTGKRYPAGNYPVVITWVRERPDEPVECKIWPYHFKNEAGKRLYPFDIMHNMVLPGDFWALSDVEMVEQQQFALNRGESVILSAADRRARPKYYGLKTLLATEEARAAFESRMPDKFIGLAEQANQEPFGLLPLPAEAPETEQLIVMAREDMARTMSVSDFSKGTTLPGDQTATAVNALVNLQEIGPASEEELLSKCVSAIGQKHWDLRRQFALDVQETSIVAPKASPAGLFPAPDSDINKGDSAIATLPGDSLPDVMVTMMPESSKKQDSMRKATVLTNVAMTAMNLGLLRTPMNPMGIVDGEKLMKLLVDASNIVKDPNELFDLSQSPPTMPQQPGMPETPGTPGTPPMGGAGVPGAAPNAGAPPMAQPGPPQPPMMGPPSMGAGGGGANLEQAIQRMASMGLKG